MKLSKILIFISIVSLLASALTGCAPASPAKNEPEVKNTLTVGLTPAVDAIPFIIAKENGYFEKQGLDIQFEVFKSAKDRDAAFQSGALDGALSDIVGVCLYQNGGFDVKITSMTDGDFLFVAGKDSGIQSMQALKGKKVALSEKTVIEYTLDKMLEKNGIKPEEIEKVAIPAIPVRLEMLKNNQVDAALLPEPFATFALKDGALLLDTAYSEGMFPAVSVFTQKAIDAKGKEISAFYAAYDEAVEYVNKTPIAEYEAIVIKTIGYPEDMKGKIELPEYRKTILPTDSELAAAIDWAVKKGLAKDTLKPSNLVNDIGVK